MAITWLALLFTRSNSGFAGVTLALGGWAASLLFAGGLVSDARELWARFGPGRLGRWAAKAIVVLHTVFVSVLALALARQVANDITGVPPEKLGTSTAIAALLFGPLIWVGVAIIVGFVVYAALMFGSVLWSITDIYPLRSAYLATRNSTVVRFVTGWPRAVPRRSSTLMWMGRVAGIVTVLLVCASALDVVRNHWSSERAWYAKAIFWLDYYPHHDCTNAQGSRVAFLDDDRIGVARWGPDGIVRYNVATCEHAK